MDGPQSIHILHVDPSKARIEAERALGNGIGREQTSSMAQRRAALAAVNGGFFRIGGRFDGEPDGILKIRENWYSDPSLPRGAIGWTLFAEERWIGRVAMKWELNVNGTAYSIDGINRPRAPAEAVLYNWAFHRSTLSDPGGREYRIASGRISSAESGGDAAIPAGGYVYSLGAESKVRTEELRAGLPATIQGSVIPADGRAAEQGAWNRADYIVGGVPVLIQSGEIVVDFSPERARPGFAEDRHPRTAVGFLPGTSWVFVVVDGRQPDLSLGMTLPELAAFMKALGCHSALNLDGGGSTTMVLRGRIVNSPSDAQGERPVSDAFLIFER